MKINVEQRRGQMIGHFGPMHSGKTTDVEATCSEISHTKYKLIAFAPQIHKSRDGSMLSARKGKLTFPANLFDENNPQEVLRILKEAEAALRNGKNLYDVVVLNEVHFCAPQIYHVAMQLLADKYVVIADSIDYSYRGEEFEQVAKVKGACDEIHLHRAACSIIEDGEKCSRDAKYSVRFKKREEGEPEVYIEDEEGKLVEGITWALYYEPTKVPEGVGAVYSTACDRHFKIPGKEETHEVLGFIFDRSEVKVSEVMGRFSGLKDLDKIVSFLVDERGVRREGDTFRMQNYRLHPAGFYVPTEK